MIREAKMEDLEEIDDMARESWLQGFSHLLTREELDKARDMEFISEDGLQENLDEEGVHTLVYEKDDRLVGRGRVAWKQGEVHGFVDPGNMEVQLRAFYIHPDYWRQGIGTALLDALVDSIPEKFEILRVETLEGSEAVDFYRKKGFKIVDEGTFSSEDTELVENDYPTVIMEKKL